MKLIFDNHIKYKKMVNDNGVPEVLEDRLCIMSYRRNVRRLFNLISLRQNTTQLKKQIDGIQMVRVPQYT